MDQDSTNDDYSSIAQGASVWAQTCAHSGVGCAFCTDTDGGALDVDGDSCATWTENSWWTCNSRWDDDDFTLYDMCCACNGGSLNDDSCDGKWNEDQSAGGFVCAMSNHLHPTPQPSVTATPTIASICNSEGTTTYMGHTLNCILADGELFDIIPIDNGVSTCGANDANSCPAGTDIWVPRNYDHARAVWAAYGQSYITITGIYRTQSGCGSCTSYPMNSDSLASYSGVGWTSVADEPEPWFLRSTTY